MQRNVLVHTVLYHKNLRLPESTSLMFNLGQPAKEDKAMGRDRIARVVVDRLVHVLPSEVKYKEGNARHRIKRERRT